MSCKPSKFWLSAFSLPFIFLASPVAVFAAEAPVRAGQTALILDITTDRGSSPVYREGEDMAVYAQASTATNLYCFYMDGGGKISRVFPNRHHPQPLVAAQSQQQIPNNGMPIRIDRSLTMAVIRCFATQSSPSVSSPLGPEFEALRLPDLDTLTKTFMSLASDAVIATLVVTTTK